MMTEKLQIHALYVLCGLAAAILVLMWFTLNAMGQTASDTGGKVQGIDAGMFTGLTLMFREVLGRIQGIWEHGERMSGQKQLADHDPQGGGGGTRNVKEMHVDADNVDLQEGAGTRGKKGAGAKT